MKIYFYDGSLRDAPRPKNEMYYLIDAADGPTACKINLQGLAEMAHTTESYGPIAYSNTAALTNSLIALSHTYGWNEKEDHSDIYIWNETFGSYVNIDTLARGKVRYAQAVDKMYLSGVFGGSFNDSN